MKKFLAASFFCIFACAAFGGEIAAKMAEHSKDVKSIYAEFTQERTISLLEEKSFSSGFFVSDTAGNVRWQINEPFKSATLCTGGDTSTFEYQNGSWLKLKSESGMPMAKIVEEIKRLMTGNLEGSSYKISEAGGKIILIPAVAAARKFVSEIKITPLKDFSAPALIEIKAPNGDITLIKMGKNVFNPANIADAFKTKLFSDYSPK